ncbi:uncharacterized protein [Coffea arabica]|uniref:ATP-dependent DNA helicase n=1 Tax=Coffea arabica TaxID=13443 RepID=A0ABM4WPJ1_COFAR
MLLHIGRLLQQYVVDMYVKIESTRLDFHRNTAKRNQTRTELYQGIVDSISQGEASSSNVGKRILLPQSFIGGPRDMKRRYMDSMDLVQRHGKPDIFLTMTCNQNWPEIKNELLKTDQVENRPDLISQDDHAKSLNCLYVEFPEHFIWNRTTKQWDCRQNKEVVGRNIKQLVAKEIETEKTIVVSDADLAALHQLNSDQRIAYDKIMNAVLNKKSEAFFVDGPGGTGKTFLYKTLLATIRSKGGIALATATSGVAGSILPGGRTSYSRFKIPLYDDDATTCSIGKQSAIAHLIKNAELIIWDEATMAKRKSIEEFNEMLQDLMQTNLAFGGKIIVFGGDFRQTLPMVSKGHKEDIINASFVKSPLWQQLPKLRLQQNMRARKDPDFYRFLLIIGNGTQQINNSSEVVIPTSMNIPFVDDDSSLETLINVVFPSIESFSINLVVVFNRAILMTRNDFVHDQRQID